MKVKRAGKVVVCWLIAAVWLLCGCSEHRQPEVSESGLSLDLQDAEQAGELIVGTLSGPETYYVSHGKEFGLHFGLVEDFANSLGLRLRVETARDTMELALLLDSGKVDLVAYPFSDRAETPERSVFTETGWLVRTASVQTRKALSLWYSDDKRSLVLARQSEERSGAYVQRRVMPQVQARGKGKISSYDPLFRKYGSLYGWDWRLLAAVCYQESAFDPEATSWAGARGLMQIMPQTADLLGLARDRMYEPEPNIEAGARYLAQLERQLSDISVPAERRLFALAAYNGGLHHIRDAMALAKKYGRGAQRWKDVAPYVLKLQEPRYYRDEVVNYGYMIGQETYAYVDAIQARYRAYCGVATPAQTPAGSGKRNRFSRQDTIVARTDSVFN